MINYSLEYVGVFALARSAVVWIRRMRLIFIEKVGGARGTLFTERDNIHSDNELECKNAESAGIDPIT